MAIHWAYLIAMVTVVAAVAAIGVPALLTKRCPQCGKRALIDTAKCSKCGAAFSADTRPRRGE